MSWYDGVYLKGRCFTAHEKRAFANHTGVTLTQTADGAKITGERIFARRPMNLQLTHYHHMNALLAFISCHTDLALESIIHYDDREIVTMDTN